MNTQNAYIYHTQAIHIKMSATANTEKSPVKLGIFMSLRKTVAKGTVIKNLSN